jgi:hypothetical protein
MRIILITAAIGLFLFFSSCNEKQIVDPEASSLEYDISGSAQKGPFINGSDVTIYELFKDFKPTGRSFIASTDEKGYFSLPGVMLVSPYVKLVANGFYFNEVSGDLSNEKLSLKAIVDLSEANAVNINVLTNLEFERVQNLIEIDGLSISDAKMQAQDEILKIFSLDSFHIEKPELLDISDDAEGDAVLLAVSAILQANRTTAELSKLQADMIQDMQDDGVLNDTVIQTSLYSQAVTLNLEQIRQNLIEKYDELGIVLERINDFDTVSRHFINHSDFHFSSPFQFPASTSTGTNFLALENTEFRTEMDYAFAAKIPETGKILVKLTRTMGNGLWWYQPFRTYGWKVSAFDFGSNQQTFESTLNGEIIDLPISFSQAGIAKVEYFFNGSEIPFLSKIVSWGAEFSTIGKVEFPFSSPGGPNLLALPDSSVILTSSNYILGARCSEPFNVEFKLHFPSTITIEFMLAYGEYTYTVSEGQIEFSLSGKDILSEIALYIKGKGTIEIENVSGLGDQPFTAKTLVFYGE